MAGDLMVLPPGTDSTRPSPRDQALHYVDRALDAWGLVARDEMAYQRREHTGEIDGVLGECEGAGILVRVAVEGIPETAYWVRPMALETLGTLPSPGRRLRILSPFDPFLIHRKRIRRLFGFDFALECYVPAPKRTFGYFALPLLKGDRFVGLLDAKADRASGILEVRNLRYDGPAKGRAAFDEALGDSLTDFARFNGCGSVRSPGAELP